MFYLINGFQALLIQLFLIGFIGAFYYLLIRWVAGGRLRLLLGSRARFDRLHRNRLKRICADYMPSFIDCKCRLRLSWS
jgi:hypothetical protein